MYGVYVYVLPYCACPRLDECVYLFTFDVLGLGLIQVADSVLAQSSIQVVFIVLERMSSVS